MANQWKPQSLVVIIISSLLVMAISKQEEVNGIGGEGQKVGATTLIEDAKIDKKVQALGKWSVKEFNRAMRKTGNSSDLTFVAVTDAKKQVVQGIKYYLSVAVVTSEGTEAIFEAVVLVKPRLRSKQLLQFFPLPDDK